MLTHLRKSCKPCAILPILLSAKLPADRSNSITVIHHNPAICTEIKVHDVVHHHDKVDKNREKNLTKKIKKPKYKL